MYVKSCAFQTMYDIGIVGAGPAGTTLARLLADRFRILLLDRGCDKCCGGILAPEAQKMLARLDLALPREVLVDPQPFAVAVLDMPTGQVRHYARQYVNIDRAAFDCWLLSLLPAGVDLRVGAVYRETLSPESRNEDEPLEIRFTQRGRSCREKVRVLVGADGAASAVRREFFSNPVSLQRYIAIQDWHEMKNGPQSGLKKDCGINFAKDYVGIFDPEATDFYAWTIPKNDRLVVGGALPFEKGARRRFEKLKAKLESFGLKLGAVEFRESGQLVRPRSTSAIHLGSSRVALLGEAAGLISPSSAEGISPALFSAWALSNSFDGKRVDPNRYKSNVGNLLWSIWRKNLKSPCMFHPGLRNWIMKTGLTSLEKCRFPEEN